MSRSIIGTVSSNATDKTIVVKVERKKTHPLYRKQYTVTTKFMAHDEKNEAKIGDKVEIVECRPISSRKRFKLNKIINSSILEQEALTPLKIDEPAQKKKTPKENDQ